MINEQNLINLRERTTEEQRAISSQGGKASAKARRKRKELRGQLRALLSAINENGKAVSEEICLALIAKALSGDVRAFEVIRDTIGEKPVDKVREKVSTKGGGLRVILLGDNGKS